MMNNPFLCPLIKIEPPNLNGGSNPPNNSLGSLFSNILMVAPLCLMDKCPAYIEQEMTIAPVDDHGNICECCEMARGIAWRCTALNSPWRLKCDG